MKSRAGSVCLVLAAATITLNCSGEEEGTRRTLLKHWPAHGEQDLRVRCAGEEVYSGGEWLKDGAFLFIDAFG
ncbi:MAG: hypothetical protein V3T22_04795, partial [Planctomycetota bacterium]